MPTATVDDLERHITRYTEGDCWILALALAERSGWTVAATADEGHIFIIKPDSDLALDIEGLRPLESLLASWGGRRQRIRRFENLTEAKAYFNADDWGSYSKRYQWRLAERVAERLLACVNS